MGGRLDDLRSLAWSDVAVIVVRSERLWKSGFAN